MIKEAIAQLVKRNDLTAETMGEVMEEIMTNQATDAQKASFLTALAMKGETIDEITAAAKVMRAHCERFLNDMDVLEIVGTGGDGSNTFNISTLSSFVASAAGIPVAKHGNRSVSSKSGAADVLEELGVSSKEAAPVLRLLCEQKKLVRVKDGLYYGNEAVEEILDKVRLWFSDHEDLDVGGLKEILGLSRKYLIALLEFMDREKITVRVGDARQYRGR